MRRIFIPGTFFIVLLILIVYCNTPARAQTPAVDVGDGVIFLNPYPEERRRLPHGEATVMVENNTRRALRSVTVRVQIIDVYERGFTATGLQEVITLTFHGNVPAGKSRRLRVKLPHWPLGEGCERFDPNVTPCRGKSEVISWR